MEVDRQDALVALERQVDGERGLEDACIVDEDIDWAAKGLGPVDELVERACVGQVPTQRQHRYAELGQFLAVDSNDPGALCREPLGDRSADAVRRSGDERRAAFEQRHHRTFRSPVFVPPMVPPMLVALRRRDSVR